ncbi:hypothetical protein [Bordetella sp. BOR01]|uniref:hypothetical protein n=1 Tax=Bordetella sp. BOR01 TaxID=2854779 RepID=UPI001C447C50|nr:hypothetical protein [Bordetella sp. BOR01]MBV7482545.1 hypothetical protein [Bordetella sp. BOR01]
MTPSCHCRASRGQATLETVLALALLALFMHGIATVGALQMQGLQAAQLSRHAAFAAARGQADIPPWNQATISTARSRHIDANTQAGDPQTVVLANDWLRADPQLRAARARVYPNRSLPFARRDEPGAFLSVQRHTVLAENAGHAYGEAATVQRIGLSHAGWLDAAQRSQSAAQALYPRMRPVDAPWGRGAWSIDWLGPWADLAPAGVGSKGR